MHPLRVFRTQQPARDGCTTWKWACFRSGAKFEPLSRQLQPGIRFFHNPIPPHPTGRLAASLPSHRGAQADSGAYHVPLIADSAVVIRDACPFRVCLSRGCASGDVSSFARRTAWQLAFWLWPDSRFGHSILTRVQSTVHVRYPCGTCLAPHPPSCRQSPRMTSRSMRATKWETLLVGLHTGPLPALHAILGNCWSHNRSRHQPYGRA